MNKNLFFSRLNAEETAELLLGVNTIPRIVENAIMILGEDVSNHQNGCVVIFDENDGANAERAASFFPRSIGGCLVKYNYKIPKAFMIEFVSSFSIDQLVDQWVDANIFCDAEFEGFVKCLIFQDGPKTVICSGYSGVYTSEWAKKVVELSVILGCGAAKFL